MWRVGIFVPVCIVDSIRTFINIYRNKLIVADIYGLQIHGAQLTLPDQLSGKKYGTSGKLWFARVHKIGIEQCEFWVLHHVISVWKGYVSI